MNFYSDMKSILTSINEAIPDMPWLKKVGKKEEPKASEPIIPGTLKKDMMHKWAGLADDIIDEAGYTRLIFTDLEDAEKCMKELESVGMSGADIEDNDSGDDNDYGGYHVTVPTGDMLENTVPIVGKAPIADPTSDIPVKYLNTLGNTIFISVSGHKYGYSPIDDRTPDHLVRSFRGMLRYSPWKALNWLSKNAKLVSGSEKGVPTVARGISTYEKADYVCHINDLVEYLLDGMSINEVLEVTDYLTEQVAMIHPQIKSMNDLIRETMLMLNNKDLIGHVKSMDDYPDYSVLYIDAGADKAKMTEFVQDLGWISQESKLVLTPLDETEEDIPVDEVSNKQWVFLLSFDKLPEHIIAKIRTGGDKQRVMLNTQSLPAPSVPPEAPAEGEVDITT